MAKKKTVSAAPLTELEKRLATALYKTWEMLPGDLSLVYTDNHEYWTDERIVEMSEQAAEAWHEAESRGWRRPD